MDTGEEHNMDLSNNNQDNPPKKPGKVTKELTKINKDIKDKLTTINEGIKDELKNINEGVKGELRKITVIQTKLDDIETKVKKIDGIETKVKKIDGIEGKLTNTEQVVEKISREQSNIDVEIDDYVEKNRSLLLAWKIVLMILAVLLFASGLRIYTAQSCPLEMALKYIYLENVPYPCKYAAIKEDSAVLWVSGIIVFVVNAMSFCLMLFFRCSSTEKKKSRLMIVVVCVSVICFVGMASIFFYFVWTEDEQKNISYINLQSSMLSQLKKNYASDVIDGSNEISNGWNKLFIDYDCCAVQTIEGTTNDFDNTPWCTTSGTCQATSSQIPKTCCKDVTFTDYQSAPNACHASVNPGTFKSSCISRMKELSTESIPGYQIIINFILGLFIIISQAVDVYLLIIHLTNYCRSNNYRFCRGTEQNA